MERTNNVMERVSNEAHGLASVAFPFHTIRYHHKERSLVSHKREDTVHSILVITQSSQNSTTPYGAYQGQIAVGIPAVAWILVALNL